MVHRYNPGHFLFRGGLIRRHIMKIAIIGIGNVGGTLGPAWIKAGHVIW
jgi:hypothetical protein